MDIRPLHFELLGFRAKEGALTPPIAVGMKIEHQWQISEDRDELAVTLMLTLENKDDGTELSFAAVLARFAVEDLREHRNAVPDALYIWIGHSVYDTIRGVMLAHADGTVLRQILLPLAPDQAFLPQAGLRSISLN